MWPGKASIYIYVYMAEWLEALAWRLSQPGFRSQLREATV